MRPHRSTIVRSAVIASLALALVLGACDSNKKEVASAKRSVFDTDFAVIYSAALDVTRDLYPNLDDAPGRGAIKTAWHQVVYANTADDLSNPQTVSNGQGVAPNQNGMGSPAAAQGGMPTRLAYKRYFVRFEVSVMGGRPWRLKVVGHAAEWEPGAAMPSELHGIARPAWLEGRTDALLLAIYKKIKPYAIPMKEELKLAPEEEVGKTDPAVFTGVTPTAGKRLAMIKDALGHRDYPLLQTLLADDVVWSLGGGSGADAAMATWEADGESLDQMGKMITAGCAGDAKRVACPAGDPKPGVFQLVIEPRGDAWKITSFVKGE